MNYLIQELRSIDRQIRGHERVHACMAAHIDSIEEENEELRAAVQRATRERDEAQELLNDLQREKVLA